MNIQYQLELILTKLALKHNPASQGLFRITLVDENKEIEPNSSCFQTQQIKIDKEQKTVDISSLSPFKFTASRQADPKSYLLKFQVKGLEQNHIQSVPLPISKIMSQFIEKQKAQFEESFNSKTIVLEYKIVICPYEQKGVDTVTAIKNQAVMEEQQGTQDIKAVKDKENAKEGRMKKSRPPQLNILKKSQHKSRAISLDPESNKAEDLKELNTPNLTVKESQDELQSAKGLRKKASSLPLSEIEKVNELLATHHRPEEKGEEKETISYKLKIVIFMVVLGIIFLLYDTFADRSIRKATQPKSHKKKPSKGKKKDNKSNKSSVSNTTDGPV